MTMEQVGCYVSHVILCTCHVVYQNLYRICGIYIGSIQDLYISVVLPAFFFTGAASVILNSNKTGNNLGAKLSLVWCQSGAVPAFPEVGFFLESGTPCGAHCHSPHHLSFLSPLFVNALPLTLLASPAAQHRLSWHSLPKAPPNVEPTQVLDMGGKLQGYITGCQTAIKGRRAESVKKTWQY